MTSSLDTIVELNTVLGELAAQRQRFEGVPESMKELHEEHQSIRTELDRLEQEALEAEQLRRASEGSADELVQKIEHYQKQINQVSTQREYGALLSEIDAARTLKQEHEEAGLLALERNEEALREREELQTRFTEVDSEYSTQLEQWEREKPGVGEQINELEGRLEVLRGQLPPRALEQFSRLFERHQGDPMARIEKVERAGPTMYRCSVCNYSVRPQVVVEIQSGAGLVTCECGRQRIFYLDLES